MRFPSFGRSSAPPPRPAEPAPTRATPAAPPSSPSNTSDALNADARAHYATRFAQDSGPGRSPYPPSDTGSFHSEASSPGGSLPVFHGTTREAAHNIRDNGFQIRAKNEGATAGAGVDNREAPYNHYFTTKPERAKEMAEESSWHANLSHREGDNQPAVVRAVLPPEYRDTLLVDSLMPRESDGQPSSFISPYDTPASYITETRVIDPPQLNVAANPPLDPVFYGDNDPPLYGYGADSPQPDADS